MWKAEFLLGLTVSSLVWVMVVVYCYKRWQRQREKITTSHDHFVHVMENTKDFIYYYELHPKRQYKYLSPSAEHFFGEGSIKRAFNNPEIPFIDIHPDDYEILMKKVKGEIDFQQSIIQRWKDKKGEYRWFEEYATPIYENGNLVALQGVLRNIDERVVLQEKLEYRMNHDNLTGLFNRQYFDCEFDRYNEQKDVPISIILCDLDELKYVNDHYGHKDGDALIKEAACLLNQFSSDNTTVARIGGDEFVMLLTHTSLQETEQLVNELKRKIEIHCDEVDSNIRIKMSIGYGFTIRSLGNMEELFSQADKDMYKNKTERKKNLIIN